MIRRDEPEYDVIWNGVNDGQDGDLLTAELRISDKTGGAGDDEARRSKARRAVVDALATAVWAVLPDRREDAWVFSVVVAKTGLTKPEVTCALGRLRTLGRLHTATRVGFDGWRCRPPLEYWSCPGRESLLKS